MYSIAGIFQMLFYIVILVAMIGAIIAKFNISNIKIMLLGIAIIVFSNAVLKDMIKYGIDDFICIIGFSICIIGFLEKSVNLF